MVPRSGDDGRQAARAVPTLLRTKKAPATPIGARSAVRPALRGALEQREASAQTAAGAKPVTGRM